MLSAKYVDWYMIDSIITQNISNIKPMSSYKSYYIGFHAFAQLCIPLVGMYIYYRYESCNQ